MPRPDYGDHVVGRVTTDALGVPQVRFVHRPGHTIRNAARTFSDHLCPTASNSASTMILSHQPHTSPANSYVSRSFPHPGHTRFSILDTSGACLSGQAQFVPRLSCSVARTLTCRRKHRAWANLRCKNPRKRLACPPTRVTQRSPTRRGLAGDREDGRTPTAIAVCGPAGVPQSVLRAVSPEGTISR